MKKFILPQAVLDVVKFTVSPVSGRVVTLDGFTAPCSGMVDWGDGTASPLVSTAALSHTYADNTARQIAVRGVVGGFWNTTSSAGKNLVTSLDEISSESLVTLQNAFRGCTGLRSVPTTLLMPNVANLNYTFYGIRSITSNLTPLWLSHAAKPHANCFTDCFLSMYGQYSSGCSYRQYVSAVPSMTYFQKYGQSGCPSATYKAGTPQRTFYDVYGTGCSSCVTYNSSQTVYTVMCGSCNLTLNAKPLSGRVVYICNGSYPVSNYSSYILSGHASECKYNNSSFNNASRSGYYCNSSCKRIYSYASSAYYSCSYFGGTCKTSGCSRTYQSGQSAYYRCTRSGGTCQDSSCPYPYANETSYNNARSNGWA